MRQAGEGKVEGRARYARASVTCAAGGCRAGRGASWEGYNAGWGGGRGKSGGQQGLAQELSREKRGASKQGAARGLRQEKASK